MSDGSLIFDTGIDNSGFTKGIAGLKSAALAAAAAVTVAFTAASAAVVNVGTSYTSAMSQVSATMGITRASEDYAMLSEAAEDMGAKTKYSATQAGEALNYLALAGYEAQESVSALPTVLNLAAAGGIDLAYASDMVTDSMSALGMSMNELEGFTDQLAKTSQKSNTSVAQLGEAILTVGGTAKSLSGGVSELNTMLGVIADNGVKGAEGGTALRNVILSLSAPTDTAAAAMEKLGVSAFDLSGNLRYLPDVFADFNTALSSLKDNEKSQILSDIFNKVDLKTVNALLGTSAERFDELAGYIEDSSGAAAQMAETMSDNLQGDLDAFNSALEGLGITAFSKFEQPMRTAVKSVTEDISALNAEIMDGQLSESFDRISESAGRLVSAVGEVLANNLIPSLINGMTAIVEHGGEIISIIMGIKVAMVGINLVPTITAAINTLQMAQINVALLSMEFGTAGVTATALGGGLTFAETAAALFSGKITIATAAQAAFNAVCAVNPIYLIAGAIAAAVTGIGLYISHVNKAASATETLAQETNKYAEAMDKVVKSNQESINDTNAEIGVLKDKADRYEELRQRYNTLTKGEMSEFLSLCEELQSVLPEGTSLIDEQTGAYNSLADSIDNVCRSMEAQAVLNAKYKEYEEAAAQNYDIEKQIQRAEEWAEANGHYVGTNIYDPKAQINLFAETEFGISYKDLLETQSKNQQIIDDYHQLYEDTYNELNGIESQYYDSAAEQHRIAAQEYARNISSANAELLAEQEKNTSKLEDEFKNLDHEYATGIITSEQDLYERKRALVEEYGNAELEEHWKFYEELYSYEKDFAEESARLEEERADDAEKKATKFQQMLVDNLKSGYKKQLEATKNGISDTLSAYKTAMSELESNISGYKAKLLSVGDIFSVEESEKNGVKTRTYTIENIEKQMEEMRKYHNYVKQLKASGASDGLLSELTSLDFADGSQFGKYLTGLSDSEFNKINDYYKARDALADELSQDLYAGEAEKINNALLSTMDAALEQLPVQAREAGRQMLAGILEGMDLSADDLSEEISSFTDSFSELYNAALEEIDLEHGFSVILGGMNTYAMGQSLARDFAAGFNDELAKNRSEITVQQSAAAADLAAGSGSTVSAARSKETNSEPITVETTNHITVNVDSEKVSEKIEKRTEEKERRTG